MTEVPKYCVDYGDNVYKCRKSVHYTFNSWEVYICAKRQNKRMRRGTLLLLISLLLLTGGCKKSNPASAVIKTVQYPISNETYTYQYNSNGTVNNIQGSLGDATYYGYSGTRITAEEYDNNGNASMVTTYFLNAQNLADSVAVLAALSYSYKNTYNSNGYLISQRQYDGQNNLVNIVTDSIVNGNPLSIRGDGTLTVNTFNNHANSIGTGNMGQRFLGTNSKNLLNSSNATGAGETNYSYTYDSEGRVTSQTLNNVTNSSTTTYFYTYY